MTDPKRLLDDHSALGQELLRAAEQVTPMPSAVLARTLKRVELAQAAAPHLAQPLGSLVVAKWFGLGLVLGAVSVAVVQPWIGTRAPTDVRPSAAPSLPSSPSPARTTPEIPVGAPILPGPVASVPPALSSDSAAPPELGLGAEAEFVDAASRALRARDASGALRILERYGRRFPGGQLTPEAELLRLQAFVMLGDFGRVEVLSARLLREQPEGTYAERVRAVIGEKKSSSE